MQKMQKCKNAKKLHRIVTKRALRCKYTGPQCARGPLLVTHMEQKVVRRSCLQSVEACGHMHAHNKEGSPVCRSCRQNIHGLENPILKIALFIRTKCASGDLSSKTTILAVFSRGSVNGAAAEPLRQFKKSPLSNQLHANNLKKTPPCPNMAMLILQFVFLGEGSSFCGQTT